MSTEITKVREERALEAQAKGRAANIAEEDLLRANCYGLLARLLRAPPGADLLAQTAEIEGDDSEFGSALAVLSRAARATAPEALSEEYQDLFIGVGSGELVPYASYYLTGFLQEKPLAALRQSMMRLGIERAADVKEPEDHIAALCECMAGLISGAFGAPADLATQQEFFAAHIERWAPRFFEDLENAKSATFYAPVGAVGRLFMGIEAAAFEMVGGGGARRPH